MSAADNAVHPARPLASTALTVLCFAALGPPLGMATALLMQRLAPGFTDFPFFLPPGMGLENPLSIFITLTAFLISYAAGGAQALLCGSAVAAFSWLKGEPPLWFALGVAGLVFAGSHMLMWRELPDTIPTMLAVHLVPAILCWLITRRLWQEA
jgi:hypothetical protein